MFFTGLTSASIAETTGSSWKTEKSQHFVIYYQDAPAGFIDELIYKAEDFHKDTQQALPLLEFACLNPLFFMLYFIWEERLKKRYKMRKIFYLIIFFCLILSVNSFALASDSEAYESSTAQTYYDYVLRQHQEQANKLVKFKYKIGGTVANLKEDIEEPSAAVKGGQRKYANTKESVILGSLSGTRGKLELGNKEDANLSTVIGVTDMQITGLRDTGAIDAQKTFGQPVTPPPVTPPPVTPPPVTPPPVIPRICQEVCQYVGQTGYGQTVCQLVCN